MPLDRLVDSSKVVHKFLPKQGEIEKPIKHINKNVLWDTHLPGFLKDLKAAYLTSPHFRDIYLYLPHNNAPLNRITSRRLHTNALNYMVLDGLLFKIIEQDGQ